MIIFLLTLAAASSPLKTGDLAPDFSVMDSEGTTQHLADLVKAGSVVVAFFPKAFTPGCTQELTTYQEQAAHLHELGITVLAVSNDDQQTLQRFRSKLKAPYPFIPDAQGALIKQYGVRQWPLKMAKRTTFVIDKTRHIVRIDRDGDAVDPTHAIDAAAPGSK